MTSENNREFDLERQLSRRSAHEQQLRVAQALAAQALQDNILITQTLHTPHLLTLHLAGDVLPGGRKIETDRRLVLRMVSYVNDALEVIYDNNEDDSWEGREYGIGTVNSSGNPASVQERPILAGRIILGGSVALDPTCSRFRDSDMAQLLPARFAMASIEDYTALRPFSEL